MAAGDTQITLAGNLVDDPELTVYPGGQPVARFRVASTPRFRDNSTGGVERRRQPVPDVQCRPGGGERGGEPARGMRIIVSGALRQRSYEIKEGEKRTVYESGGR